MTDQTTQSKVEECRRIIGDLGSIAVAFSGGVDSTLLLALAVETLGPESVLAVTGVSQIHPPAEYEDAVRLAGKIGVELVTIQAEEMNNPKFTSNPPEKCYHCKKGLLIELRRIACSRGLAAIATGANADDTGDFRPGLRAGQEMGAARPLMAAGLTKPEIRQISREMGLPTWDALSAACLASRIPYGQPITPEKLSRITQGEQFLRSLGFVEFRLRDHGDIARIEVKPTDFDSAVRQCNTITTKLKELGYAYVTLDLQGFRRGSMNDVL